MRVICSDHSSTQRITHHCIYAPVSYDLSSRVIFCSNVKSPGHPISAFAFAPFLAVVLEQLSGQNYFFQYNRVGHHSRRPRFVSITYDTGILEYLRVGDEFRSGFLTFPTSGAKAAALISSERK